MTVLLSWQKTRPEKSRGPPEQLRFNIPVEKNSHSYGATCAHDYEDALDWGPVVKSCGSDNEVRVVGIVGKQVLRALRRAVGRGPPPAIPFQLA